MVASIFSATRGTPTPIRPANDRVSWVGDSRSDQARDGTGVNLLPIGRETWAQPLSGNAFLIDRNFGLTGDKSSQILTRALATFVASDTDTNRRNGSADPDAPAGLVVLLDGINDAQDWPILGAAPSYADYMLKTIDAHINAGHQVLLCNELPKGKAGLLEIDPAGAEGLAQLARRDWCESAAPRSGVTQSTTNDGVVYPGGILRALWVRQIDTFRPCLQSGHPLWWNPAYTDDGVHQNIAGARAIGAIEGAVLAAIYTGTNYAQIARVGDTGLNLPNPLFARTTGGTLTNSASATALTGNVADSTTLQAVSNCAGLTITASMATDANGYAEQVITITGISGASVPVIHLIQTTSPTTIANAAKIRAAARVRVDVGCVGLLSSAWNARFNSTYQRAWGVRSGTAQLAGFELPVVAPDVVNGSGGALAFTSRLEIQLAASTAISATIRTGRWAAPVIP